MKIALFADTYYPQINGVVTSVRMLEKELIKKGHDVFIYCTTDPNVKRTDKKKTPFVFRLPSIRLWFLPTHRLAFFYTPAIIFKIKKIKPDIIHTHTEYPVGFFGWLMSLFCRAPMVHTYHTMYKDYVHYARKGMGPILGKFFTVETAHKLSRNFCNKAKAVITPTEKVKQYLFEVGVAKPINIIPTGVDVSHFYGRNFLSEELDSLRAEFGIGAEDRIILTVGRVAKEKNMYALVSMMPEVLKKIPNAKLLIVGDGPMREPLSETAREKGISGSVIFAGYRKWEEIGKFYKICDLFMTASTSETQGLTHIEAMASGKPVAVINDESFTGIVRDGETGYVFQTDSDAAEAALRVLLDKKKSDAVAANGYAAVQKLSAEQFAINVENVYMSVIK
ncbi:MAG: glycosyltransferase [Defluviitaleaceae bacterium]|nr:glycosyltransferase [Defluviitaleaceae bacterium]